MKRLRAISLFFLGVVAGVGVACTAAGVTPPDAMWAFQRNRPLTTVLTGLWLVAFAVLGVIGVAMGRRTGRLRTVMVLIAILAVMLSLTVGAHRRSARFAALAQQHLRQGRAIYTRIDDMLRRGGTVAVMTPLYQEAHRHDILGRQYDRIAARPWRGFSLPKPCACRLCAAPPGNGG